MVNALNGLGWYANTQLPSRVGAEQAQGGFMPQRPVAPIGSTTAQHNSQGSTAGNAEDNEKEAFAKLMVMLQNPDTEAREQASVGKQKVSNAVQEFRDYMAKSPEEKIKEKILQELGLTEDEFEALPPEQKAKVMEQIAERLQEDVQIKTQAKIEQQAESEQAGASAAVAAADADDREKQKTAEL